jgi:di/tricarboxylate transporter
LSAIVFGIFGGRHLLERRVAVEPAVAAPESPRGGPPPVAGGSGPAAGEGAAEALALDRDKVPTLIGILALIVVALAFDVDVGFVALSIAAVLSVISPQATKGAVDKVAWSTVLLVCGIVTYVGLLENIGAIDWLGEHVADIGAALIAAMLICYVGGVVSAFASTTGILGALIPLAVPFLKTGSVGAVGLIIALSISSSVVDASPFSTSGALTVANSPQDRRDFVFRGLMRWGFGVVLIAPLVAWCVFVLPGWL